MMPQTEQADERSGGGDAGQRRHQHTGALLLADDGALGHAGQELRRQVRAGTLGHLHHDTAAGSGLVLDSERDQRGGLSYPRGVALETILSRLQAAQLHRLQEPDQPDGEGAQNQQHQHHQHDPRRLTDQRNGVQTGAGLGTCCSQQSLSQKERLS